MRIAIDISSIIYGTGVSAYTKNLVKNLLKIDKESSYIFFGGSLRRRSEIKEFFDELRGASFKGRSFPIPPSLASFIWNRLHILPIERLVGKLDVFHSSDWAQPPARAFKVTTIHDLVPLRFPSLSHPKIVAAHNLRMKWVKREVDRVIVPSQTTAYDAVKLGIDEAKIRVIPEAPDPIFKRAKLSEIEKLKRKYRISGNYLLAIGVNPRKNINRIIEAFGKIQAESKLRLVVIGHKYFDLTSTRGVMFLGHVPNEDLPGLYSGASALVYPSLYEGFGLPILEAFACKTPVVTSNLGSMVEVSGNAAILVDPYKVDNIADGIRLAISNGTKLTDKGYSRLKSFSWEKTARESLKVYRESG